MLNYAREAGKAGNSYTATLSVVQLCQMLTLTPTTNPMLNPKS